MLKLDGQKLNDGRWFTGSVERNKDPILNLLKRVLPHTGLILEIFGERALTREGAPRSIDSQHFGQRRDAVCGLFGE